MAIPSRFNIWPKVFTCAVCGTVSNASVHCVPPEMLYRPLPDGSFIRDVFPTTDDGPDGALQCVLPGAERASDAEMAQRRTNAPLKPKTTQRPCDAGLFSDSHQQQELKL